MATNLFSIYSGRENRVTSSILAVLRSLSLSRIERILGALMEQSEFDLVRFDDQPSQGGLGVPDAQITASCRILLETKRLRNSLNRDQLCRHLKRFENATEATQILLALTPDDQKPAVIDEISNERLIWASFSGLHQAIEDLFDDSSEVISEREAFLLRELQAMLVNDNLVNSPYDTVVVPARSAWPTYLKLRAYICQPRRLFQPVQRMAFYLDNRIELNVPTITAKHDDVLLKRGHHEGRLGEVVSAYLVQHPDAVGEHREVFLLTAPDDAQNTIVLERPIPNDILSESGRRVAFTQNQRYARSADLRSAKTTSELVELMKK